MYQLRDGLVLGGYRQIPRLFTIISTRLSSDLIMQNKNLNNKERLSMLKNCTKTISMMAPAKPIHDCSEPENWSERVLQAYLKATATGWMPCTRCKGKKILEPHEWEEAGFPGMCRSECKLCNDDALLQCDRCEGKINLSAAEWKEKGFPVKTDRADCKKCVQNADYEMNLDRGTEGYNIFQPLEVLGGRSIADMFHQLPEIIQQKMKENVPRLDEHTLHYQATGIASKD